jgi:hypothetical protein
MTGRYPHRHGLQTLVIPSAGTCGLATDEWLLPEALKSVGYRTAQATLPSRLELFDLSRDVTETTNVAAEHPEQEAVPPLLMGEAIGVVRSVLFGSVVIPAEAEALDLQP